jgi:hypothetical protein
MKAQALALLMVKTGTSRSDIIQNCSVFKMELDNMLKGNIPVKSSVSDFLIKRLEGMNG